MYIHRSFALKMKLVDERRINAGFLSYATHKWYLLNPRKENDNFLDHDWCMANQEFLKDGNDVAEQNSKIILTKSQAAQYKLDMDEDWPYGVSDD